jgi:hypothetical protein
MEDIRNAYKTVAKVLKGQTTSETMVQMGR